MTSINNSPAPQAAWCSHPPKVILADLSRTCCIACAESWMAMQFANASHFVIYAIEKERDAQELASLPKA